MRENDGSAFALVDIGHPPALDFQELLSSERLCAIGHCFSPLEHFGISLMSLICNNTPVGPREHCTLGSAADRPAEGRNDDATERGMIEAVVSGSTGGHVADHIHGVVHTLE